MPPPWNWADPALIDRYADGLPPPEPPPALSREWVIEQLQRPASERAQIVALVGYAPGVLPLIAADPLWQRRRTVWFLRPGHLALLAEELEQAELPPPDLQVAVYEHHSDFLVHVQRLPLIAWSLAMLDPDPELLPQIQYLRSQRLFGAYLPAERTLTDLAHLLARGDRVAAGIPLPWWRGRFAGASALCIAAGPSLDRHLDFVRRHAADCVVIAVDIVYRKLRAAGIPVDFVVNVDSHPLIGERVGRDPDPRTCLVMPVDGHRDLDPPFRLVSYVADEALGPLLLGPGQHHYTHGTNVGSCSVGWAFHLGCREAILAGHDLAFSEQAFYSSLVSDPDAIQAFNRQSIGQGLMQVPGNDGTTVQTSWDFRAGIRDLALMAEHFAAHGMQVINLNIGHGIGARIPNAVALPADWRPGPKPAVDPEAAPRCGGSGAAARLAAELVPAFAAFRQRWRELPAAGDALEAWLAIGDEPAQRLAARFAAPFIMPFVYQLYRQHAQAAVPGWRAAAAATGALVAEVLERAERLYAEVVATGRAPHPSPAAWWSEGQRAFFPALRQAVPVLTQGSLDEVSIPIIGRDWRGLAPLLPELRWTGFLGVIDALQLTAALGELTPPETLAEALAWCRLTVGAEYALDLAATHGVAEDPRVRSAPAQRAAAALEELRAAEPAALATLAEEVLAWPGGQPFLVERLLAPELAERGGTALLAELVRGERLLLDDALAALIVERHPDPVAACDLLEPLAGVRGERCALAAAERLAQIGAHQAVLGMLAEVRPLSPVAVPAVARRVASLVQLQRWDAVDGELARLACQGQRAAALYQVLAGWFGPEEALVKLLDYPQLRPVPAAVLSEVLLHAIGQRRITVALRDAVERLIAESRAAGISPAETQGYADLEQALARLRELTLP